MPWYFQCHAKDSDCAIPPKEKNGGKYRIIMVGDSVSRGDSFYGFHNTNMIFDIGEMLLKERGWAFSDRIEVMNYSVGMRGIFTEGEKPFRKDPNWNHILGSKADAIVIMLGGNDSKPWNWKGEQLFNQEYVAFGKELLKVVGDKQDLYVLSATPSYPDYPGNSPCVFNDKIMNEVLPKQFIKIVKRLDLDPKHNFVDAHHMLYGKKADFPELFHKEGYQVGD